MSGMKKPSSIDEYLSGIAGAKRTALERLRTSIRSILPEAEECISYNMPAFRYRDTVVAGFLATAKGCSYYPFSGRTLKSLAADLSKYDQTKGSLHFDPEKGLPSTLVRKLLKTRIGEI
jgi:uncharacterized protein YdhG (YjbR/CyaY superfamily)